MGDQTNPSSRQTLPNQISGPALYAAVGAIAALAGIGLGWGLWGRTPRTELLTPPPRQIETVATSQPPAAATPPPTIDYSALAPTVTAPPQRSAEGPEAPANLTPPPIEPAPSPQTPTPTPATPAPIQPPPAAPSPQPATTPAPSPAPAPAPSSLVRRINVNTASQAELELLPGIGPALATRIIEYRTQHGRFRRIDDLDSVKGIGPKVLEKLRPLVSVD